MRIRFITVISILFIIISCFNSTGQSLVRSTMSSLGYSTSQDGYIIRQTIGQPSNTSVFNSGQQKLRQGFQQPITTLGFYYSFIPIDFTLSPNPADEKTLLELKEQFPSYSITIRTINGELLEKLDDKTLLVRWLDLRNYLDGIYIVTISSDNRIGSKKLIINH